MKPEEEIEMICHRLLDQQSPFLVGVEQKGGPLPEIWVYLDSEEKDVTIEQCSRFSRDLAEKLDEEDLFTGEYRLNVSSPGLDRPLTDPRQYKKNIGRNCRVTVSGNEGDAAENNVNKKNVNEVKYEGTLSGVDENYIEITSKDKVIKVRHTSLKEIKIIPVFHS